MIPAFRVLLVNVHGGGMTQCDTVAEAVGMSAGRSTRRIPIVFRAAGNHADFARSVLSNFALDVTLVDTMSDAADAARRIADQEAR